MAVLLATSLGDIVVDLHTDLCPLTTKNFLKLCKIKYYNNCLFHSVQKDFTAQTGDPTGKGTCGDSIYKFLYGEQARFFNDEIHPNLKHSKFGTVAMASAGENLNASQFYFTLRDGLDYLDGKHTVFGEVAEGLDTLARINEAYVDDNGRPYKNIRDQCSKVYLIDQRLPIIKIKHTYILDDPFDDPPQLAELIPENSPEQRLHEEGLEVRLEDDWIPMDEQQDPEELEKSLRMKEAQSRAVVLEMIGDIPEAEIKPPENVLFVCKLNPVTQEEDLEIIFSRFGKIISADIIRDYKTGDSLCYAFIEFETQEACEAAYFKMDNVLIDDRRIHVDFSQSVAKLWTQYRRASKRNSSGEGAVHDKGRGCFKCGKPGHIAKDCPEYSKETPVITDSHKPRYILKDTNQQHGDTSKSYDMVFEEDVITPGKRKLQQDNYKKGTDKSQKGGDSETERHSKQRGQPEHYHTDRKERINQRLREEREDKISEKERDRDRCRQERERERYKADTAGPRYISEKERDRDTCRQERERDRYKANTAGPRYGEDGKGDRYKEDRSGIRNRYDEQSDIINSMEDKESCRHREGRGKCRGKEEQEVENNRENREKQGQKGKREMEIYRDNRKRENYRDDKEKKRHREEHDKDRDNEDGQRDRQKEDRAKDGYKEERGGEWSKEDREKGRHRR